MLISDLLAPWFHYSGPESFNQMQLDSRAVNPGDLFIAIPGHTVDGREFISAAHQQGAVAVIAHTDNADEHGKVSVTDGIKIFFFQLRQQLSAIGAQAYPLPVERMKIIGVTGTNGKTTVSQLMTQLVNLLGVNSAVMGTLGNGLLENGAWKTLVDSGNTTADPLTIAAQLHAYQQHGAAMCAMEVSSHGLTQGRVEAVPFDVAIFTNLSRDHLDYHHTMKAYGDAKRRLFNFQSLSASLVNWDDPVGRQWLDERDCVDSKMQGYSIEGDSLTSAEAVAFFVKDKQFHHQGVKATLVWPEGEAVIESPLLGAFNLSNLLAAIAGLYQAGFDIESLISQIPKLRPVAGRMECFTTDNDITLVVDYAHTPDALKHALTALKLHCSGELWCVFGCGGNRDKGKRPLMAQAAEQYSDHVMVTSDNVRDESAQAIIDDIFTGLSQPELVMSHLVREQAIKMVVNAAKPGDIILLAGKGHEQYQEQAGVKHHYDERAIAKAIVEGSR